MLQLEVRKLGMVNSSVLRLELDPVGSACNYKPGQFITLCFESQGKSYKRSYSMATPPGGRVELFVALVKGGVGSRYLTSLRPGMKVEAQEPQGIFGVLPSENGRTVLIATSTGVVPFRSMKPQIETLLKEGRKVSLLYGVRRSEDLLFEKEWFDWLRHYEEFEFIPCFSQPATAQDCQRFGAIQGRVQVGLQRLPLVSSQNTYSLCGNPEMIDEVEKMLIEAGIASANIMVEAFESHDIA